MALRRLSAALNKAIRGTSDEDSLPNPANLGPSSPSPAPDDSTATASVIEGDNAIILDDNALEDYGPQRIREMRRSWPQTEQETAWRLGTSLLTRPVEEEETKPSSKLAELEKSLLSDASSTDGGGKAYSNGDALSKQVINWEHLPEDVVADNDRSTVWNGGSELFDIEINEQEITKIIAMFNSGKPAISKKFSIYKTSSSGKESVLDHRRSTQVSVAMKRMRLQPSKFGKLAWALRDMNEAYLTPAAIEIMKEAQVWPTPKEIEDMRAKVREGAELADPDALLWFLATSVPDAAMRINALAFRYDFDEVVGELIRATSLIKAASMEVTNSELLKRLMRVILLVGNNINETYGGTPAWGVTLDSLKKLKKVKTADKTLSVLDCIVSYLDQMAPETFEVADDCTCVPSAAKYSLATEIKTLSDARRNLETIRKIKAMEKFYLSASKKLNDIERDLKSAKESFDRALDHFCIPRGTLDTNRFFGVLAEFFDDFDRAITLHEARQKQLANPSLVRSGLLNPAFMKARRESSMSFSSNAGNTSKLGPNRPSAYRPSVFGRLKPGA